MPSLGDDVLLEMYHTMLLARMLDERLWVLQRQGKIAFHISGMGQEGAQVGAAYGLDKDKDILHPYYRDLALMLAWGMTPREIMLSNFAKEGEPNSGARQMPAHYGDRRLRVISGSSPVATQIPQAVGVALASKIRGEDTVTMVCFGEGGSSKGDFHEALNFAGILQVPVIFLCQNNQYAISLPMEKQMAIENVADRAAGYGMPGVAVDGNDPTAVYEAVKEAADRARRGGGPTLVETKSYRLVPHSSDDDDRVYRSREEVEAAKQRDALVTFRQFLEQEGLLDDDKHREMRRQITAIVNDATDYAEQAPYPDPEEALKKVFADDGSQEEPAAVALRRPELSRSN
jgi:2-oxoisovalerate dehydrogenase E1 component alpha subunit